MKKLNKVASFLTGLSTYLFLASANVLAQTARPLQVTPGIGIPSLGGILGFIIKFFFTIAALIALIYLLLGALAWITSGGNKESVDKAQQKIQAAVIGLVVIAAVLALAVTLETYVFKQQICFGISCDIKIPSLLTGPTGSVEAPTP